MNCVIIDENVEVAPATRRVYKDDIVSLLSYSRCGIYCNGKNENGDRIFIPRWTNVEEV